MKLLDRLRDYCDPIAAERDHGLRTPEDRFDAIANGLARLEREWALQVEEEARRLWATSQDDLMLPTCANCGQRHAGKSLGGICIGCACNSYQAAPRARA